MKDKTLEHLQNSVNRIKRELSDNGTFQSDDMEIYHRGINYLVADEQSPIEEKLIPMLLARRPKSFKEQDKVIKDYLLSQATLDYAILIFESCKHQ